MHLRIHIEQNVCEHSVMTGFERNSLHTSQRKAASSGSNSGRDVFNQSVESGRSNVVSMGLWCGAMGESGGLGPGDGGIVRDASDALNFGWSRALFTRALRALSAQLDCCFRTFDKEPILACLDFIMQ